MEMVNVTVKLDMEIVNQAETLFSTLGMEFSEAINIFLVRCVREQQIPFQILNDVTLAAIADVENGVNLLGSFDSIAAMTEALESE